MKTIYSLLLLTLLATQGALSQEKTPEAAKNPDQGGFIEFGARGVWGDVYGRPDLSFKPSLRTSKYEEYRDIRDGFFINYHARYATWHYPLEWIAAGVQAFQMVSQSMTPWSPTSGGRGPPTR